MALGLGNINIAKSQAKISHFTSAMHFDGSSDFEQASDDNATTFGDATNDADFSIITWFKLDGVSGENPILLKLNEYEITATDAELSILLYDNGTSAYRKWTTSGTTLAVNKWYCAIFVANGDGSGGIAQAEMALHLNGVKKVHGSGITMAEDGYTAMHNKGNHRTGNDGSNYLDGFVAAVGIFNIAFGDAACARIYNNGVPTNIAKRHGISSSNIKAYWTYGNASGDTIAAVQDLSATEIDMAQSNASKQPALITGANVRTGVN